MTDTKELAREGIIAVLDVHRITFTHTRWIPFGIQGTCECGWEGGLYDQPVTASDYEPERVQVRQECMEHIADVLFEEAAATDRK